MTERNNYVVDKCPLTKFERGLIQEAEEDALTLRMSGEQIRLQLPSKLSGVNSWVVQMIRQ